MGSTAWQGDDDGWLAAAGERDHFHAAGNGTPQHVGVGIGIGIDSESGDFPPGCARMIKSLVAKSQVVALDSDSDSDPDPDPG